MRLIKPSLGECIDRLSILARKIEEAHFRGLEAGRGAYWQEEEDEILAYLSQARAWWVLPLHLAAVNAMIWEQQETIAEHPGHSARKAYDLNLRRADLVAQLSGEVESKEKL